MLTYTSFIQCDPENLVSWPHVLQYFRNIRYKIVILHAARLLTFLDHTVQVMIEHELFAIENLILAWTLFLTKHF